MVKDKTENLMAQEAKGVGMTEAADVEVHCSKSV